MLPAFVVVALGTNATNALVVMIVPVVPNHDDKP